MFPALSLVKRVNLWKIYKRKNVQIAHNMKYPIILSRWNEYLFISDFLNYEYKDLVFTN